MNVLILTFYPERMPCIDELANRAKQCLQDVGHRVVIDARHLVEASYSVKRGDCPIGRVGAHYFASLGEQSVYRECGCRLPTEAKREIDHLNWADMVIFQLPLWWHVQATLLKRWFERVLVYGGHNYENRHFNGEHYRAKKAVCHVVSGSPEQVLMPFGGERNLLEWLRPVNSSLYHYGFDVLSPQVSCGVQGGGIKHCQERTLAALLEHRKNWAERLTLLSSEPLIPFSGWGSRGKQGVFKHDRAMRWRP